MNKQHLGQVFQSATSFVKYNFFFLSLNKERNDNTVLQDKLTSDKMEKNVDTA